MIPKALIRPEILASLGLPRDATDTPDTEAGGRAAIRAGVSYSDLILARKFGAAASWLDKSASISSRPANRRRSKEQIETLLRLWDEGHNIRELMAIFDVYSVTAITSLLKRHGVTLPPPRWPRWHHSEDRVLIEVAAEGSSCEEIAKAIHRTPLAVARRARTLGLLELSAQWETQYYLGRKRA